MTDPSENYHDQGRVLNLDLKPFDLDRLKRTASLFPSSQKTDELQQLVRDDADALLS